ncbi:MAG TPA: cytochrome c [Terriglobales bacterium]|nr:cytochrome c [Terriglobales bacterium]
MKLRFAPLLLLLVAPLAAQQPAADYFRQNCASCHTIGGGRLTGPDLKNVAQRKDRAWLVQYMQNPKATIDSGDAYALQLQQEARGVVMPTVAGMSPAQAELLLDMIEAESKLDRSQFAGTQLSNRPFTPQDVVQGKNLFLGNAPLANGGPPCLSCHTISGVGGLGGGRLGPDLTLVYERLQGRKGTGAWLLAPASPTMQPVFRAHPLKPEEVLAITALFEDSARRGTQPDSASLLNFFLIGLGGMVLGLISLDAVWKRRFRAVRRPLVRRVRESQEHPAHTDRREP